MRLSKVNLVRKSGQGLRTPRGSFSSISSAQKHIIGSLWYLRDELDDEEARKIARSRQADGYRGNIFYGSAEKIWRKTLAKREIERSGPDRSQHSTDDSVNAGEISIGRSYGLLSDDDEDDEGYEETQLDLSQKESHHQTSLHQSYFSSSTQNDPLSPPLSPNPSHQQNGFSTPLSASRLRDESTPPMPGSFIFEDEAPASPAFSSGLTESVHNIAEILYSTPSRHPYVNPGLALESRFDRSSPTPIQSRFDMTPRQLAAFSRRRQEIEKFLERPSTPSLASDAGLDDWNISEKERAERERRRKDLQKFRLERQKRLRVGNSESEPTKKRSREDFEDMDVDQNSEENISKKSKSSEIFAQALGIEPQRSAILEDLASSAADDSQVHSPALSDNIQSVFSTNVQPVDSPMGEQSSGTAYSAPTPSPSPPPHTDNSGNSKQTQLHIPKKPSGLRNATNISSSPATSPLKNIQHLKATNLIGNLRESEYQTRAAVDSILKNSYMTFKFPPLKSSFIAQVSPDVLNELSRHF